MSNDLVVRAVGGICYTSTRQRIHQYWRLFSEGPQPVLPTQLLACPITESGHRKAQFDGHLHNPEILVPLWQVISPHRAHRSRAQHRVPVDLHAQEGQDCRSPCIGLT